MKLWIIFLLVASALGQVQVRSYTRSDGTVVAAYTRHSRGDTKLYNSSSPPPVEPPASKPRKPKPVPINPCVVVDPGFIVCGGVVVGRSSVGSVVRDSQGKIARSPAAKKSLQSQEPCPTNGKTRGRCPGYVIDHIVPLACGGLDDPVNMQWQDSAAAKAKDKWERKQCGK